MIFHCEVINVLDCEKTSQGSVRTFLAVGFNSANVLFPRWTCLGVYCHTHRLLQSWPGKGSED